MTSRWTLHALLDGAAVHPWRGPATYIGASRKLIWSAYYGRGGIAGLRGLPGGRVRTAEVPVRHTDLLSSGAEAVAREIARDLEPDAACAGPARVPGVHAAV